MLLVMALWIALKGTFDEEEVFAVAAAGLELDFMVETVDDDDDDDDDPEIKARISSFMTRPSFPVPLTRAKSTFDSFAILRTAGVAKVWEESMEKFPVTAASAIFFEKELEEGDVAGEDEAGEEEVGAFVLTDSLTAPSATDSMSISGWPTFAVSSTL